MNAKGQLSSSKLCIYMDCEVEIIINGRLGLRMVVPLHAEVCYRGLGMGSSPFLWRQRRWGGGGSNAINEL